MTAAATPGGSYQLVELDEDHLKAHAFNMLFMVWRKRTLEAPYRRGFALVRELAANFPGGVGVCQVIDVDAIPPDSHARTAFVEFMKLAPIRHQSAIHDGTGFKAAAVRAIISGVSALARPTSKQAVFSKVADAGRWHAAAQKALGRNETAERIEGIVTTLRALHRERYP